VRGSDVATDMPTPSRQSLGGQVMAGRQRTRALALYAASPRLCHFCSASIPVPPGVRVAQVRRKRFCNRSCAGSFNNKNLPKRQARFRPCGKCGSAVRRAPTTNSARVYCEQCWRDICCAVGQKKVSEISPGSLHSHARTIMRHVTRVCEVCGYDKHVEVCHVVPVSSFAPDALVSEVNERSNLRYLCPNHHWEADHPVQK
jgi:hypothetical protein